MKLINVKYLVWVQLRSLVINQTQAQKIKYRKLRVNVKYLVYNRVCNQVSAHVWNQIKED